MSLVMRFGSNNIGKNFDRGSRRGLKLSRIFYRNFVEDMMVDDSIGVISR